jgi:hypothetical protein
MLGALTVFPFAALVESPYPIVGLWTVAGCVLLYLLCRGYRRSRVMAPALLLLVASVAVGLRALDELSDPSNVNYLSWAAPTSTWISVVGPLLAIVISWRYLSERIGKSERAKAKPGGRWAAEGLTFAAMLGGLALLVRTDPAAELATFRTFVDKRWNGHPVHDEAELWLARAAIGAVVGILALVVVGGFVYGAARAVRVGRLVPRPARPTRSQRLKEARERIAVAERMGRRSQFARFRDGIELMAAAATDAVVMTGRMSWYFVASIGSEIGNLVAIVVAVIVLTLVNTLRVAATTLRDGFVLLAESGARFVVASVAIVLLVAASLATWASAEHLTVYLDNGGASHLLAGIGGAVVGALLIIIASGRFTGAPLAEWGPAVTAFVAEKGPYVYVLSVAGGWVNGAIGRFGSGPMRWGPYTIVGTALLGLAVIIVRPWKSNRYRHVAADLLEPAPTAAPASHAYLRDEVIAPGRG